MPVSISGDGIISGVSTLTTGNFVTTQSISAPTATFTGNVSIGGTLTYEDVTNIDSIGIITARSGVIVTGVTTVSAGSTSAPSITPTGDSNTGVFFPSADTIAFAEGGVEAARFDSSGRLLMGTTSAFGGSSNNSSYSFLQIRGNTYASNDQGRITLGTSIVSSSITAGANLGGVWFCDGNGGDYASINCQADGTGGTNDYPGRLIFSTTADGASTPTERMRITSSGNVTVANGNLVFSTAGTGIDFSATANSSGTMTSELLSDYEEGTFTPTIEGTSTTGTASYAVQNANYTKIGNRVIINVYIAWSSGSGTGSLMLGGLPYTPVASNTFTGVTIAFQQNITLTANNYMQGHVHNSTAKVYLTQTPTGGGALSNVAYDASGEMMISAAYPVA